MKHIKKTAVALIMSCLVLFMSFTAFAADSSQMLTVSFGRDGTAVSGATVRLYRIGTILDGEIIPEGDFAFLRVDYEYGDTQGLSDLALTLEGIVGADKLQESYRDVTDETGTADFDGASIPEGAYLVLASTVKTDVATYIPAPSIVALPYTENGVKPDTVTLELKYETVPPEETEFISRKALKVWDGDNKDMRSAEIFYKKLRTPSLLAENFHAVVFSPTDLNLIDGEPKLRRRFLDLSIGQIAPQYVEYLKEYNRAITQRNVLLKKIKDGEAVSDLL